jgi:hypothetical protein
MFFPSKLHGDSNVGARSAKREPARPRRVAAFYHILSRANSHRRTGHEYDRILELISNENWKAASDAATSYLAKAGPSEDLQARVRYIIIYATAGAVSTGASEFDVLNKYSKALSVKV